ncbi:hypothetical protein scyTo_0014230, partial [Scyliorhinus torazame]|nr:hypothetical protein [Scyliorhinus torazame]
VRGWKKKTEPGLFPHFKQQRIHFAACGTSQILFLSQAGTVYQSEVVTKDTAAATKEFFITKPQLLKSLSEKNIIQVACGNNHSLALSKEGQLFAWGQNTYGQLGIDTKGASQPVPQCVTSLTGMPVAQITAGGEHSFALSLSGAVFGWGRNDRGQLGLKDTEDRHKPNYVKLLECKKTIHISCGEEHTAVLTKIYSFGRGENGQLGNRETGDQLVPLPVNITDTPDKNGTENGLTTKPAVKRIFAGGNQSFAERNDEVGLVPSVNPSALNTLKKIMTLDSLLEKEMDKNTTKAIVRAFSSSQNLSGSFLDVSKDGHFNTNGEACAQKLFPTNTQTIINEIQQQLIPYPCIFDFETKLEVLSLETKTLRNKNSQPALRLAVSRDRIVQDALCGLTLNRSAGYFAALQVQFIGESCVGHGVSQEFFTLFSQELHSNGQIFHCSQYSELLWFPRKEPERGDGFHLVGILCGLAVSNGFICNFHFPLALYKKLLHVQPTLEDLKELSLTGEKLQKLLDCEDEDVEDIYSLQFSVAEETADGQRVDHELIPGGSRIAVQKHNRKQYVDAYVDYKLNTSVKDQFEAFSQGFRSSLSVPVVNIFHPEELRAVIHGNTEYEWELLEQNAKYNGYTQTDTTVRNFWKVFESLKEKKKKRFLTFLSGSERIPAGGIRGFRITILNLRRNEPDSFYPCAYTCHMTLDLPNYSSIEILEEKLLHAIKFSEEFNAVPPQYL